MEKNILLLHLQDLTKDLYPEPVHLVHTSL